MDEGTYCCSLPTLRMGLFGAISAALATGFLGVVVFGVPYIKQIFFLRASFGEGDFNGSVILGTLGFCLEFFNATSNGTELACSQPSIIYQPGQFPTFHFIPLGNKLSFSVNERYQQLEPYQPYR